MTIPPRQPDDPRGEPYHRPGHDPYHRPEWQPPEYEPPLMREKPGVSPVVGIIIVAAAFILVFGLLFWWWFG